jgi:hypothetical protein
MSNEIVNMQRLTAQLLTEAEGLFRLLPVVEEMQWEASPAHSVEREVQVKSTHGEVSDPTGDTVTDPARLALRSQVVRSERLLRAALVNVAGVRRGLEIRMGAWEVGE